MACKLSQNEFREVLEPLSNEWGAIRITSIARLLQDGRMPQHWFDIYVGAEQNPKLAAAVPNKRYPGPKYTTLFAHQSIPFELFSEFFDHLPLNLSSVPVTGICPAGQHLKNMLDRYLHENELGISQFTHQCKMFLCPNPFPSAESRLPPGYKLDILDAQDAEFAASNWYLTSATAADYFREAIVAGLPSTCIRTGKGDIVAHCMLADHHVGNVWVDPAHRRKGFAQLIVAEQAKKMQLLLDKVVAYIEPDNEASLNLFGNKLGWTDTKFDTYWE